MRKGPANFYGVLGSAQSAKRPCECCKEPVKGPEVYGSGRFCSELCAKLRTPEAHWNWLTDHPEELKKWQERQEKKKKGKDKPEKLSRDLPVTPNIWSTK